MNLRSLMGNFEGGDSLIACTFFSYWLCFQTSVSLRISFLFVDFYATYLVPQFWQMLFQFKELSGTVMESKDPRSKKLCKIKFSLNNY